MATDDEYGSGVGLLRSEGGEPEDRGRPLDFRAAHERDGSSCLSASLAILAVLAAVAALALGVAGRWLQIDVLSSLAILPWVSAIILASTALALSLIDGMAG